MEALGAVSLWIGISKPLALAGGAALVALCFIVFNVIRIYLYLPQLAQCWRDTSGCPAINLWIWGNWTIANASSAVYLWVIHGDTWAMLFNFVNALMCVATVLVTLAKRWQYAGSPHAQAAQPGAGRPRTALIYMPATNGFSTRAGSASRRALV